MPGYIKIGDIKGKRARAPSPGNLGSGGSGPSYLEYKFMDLMMTSHQLGGSSAKEPGSTKIGAAGPGTLKVVMPLDKKPSPFRALSTSGVRTKSITIVDNAPKSDQKGSCVYTLSGVKVADSTTKADPLPTEELTLNYEKIEWTYAEISMGYTEVEWTYKRSK